MNILDIQIKITTPYTNYPIKAPTEMPDRKYSYYVYIDNFDEFNKELIKLINNHSPKNI